MAIEKFVLNGDGVRELLRGPEIMADLARRARNVAEAAGSGYKVEIYKGKNRARATVSTESIEAKLKEAKKAGSLAGALDAGRR